VALWTLGHEHTLRETTIDVAQIVSGETILDVGCGTGTLCVAAKRRVGSAGTVYGIDASPEMIAVARHKAARAQVAVDFWVSAVEDLPFPTDSMNVVLSSLMMHHLPDDVKHRALLEIQRVLRPGGRLVIVDFKRPTTRIARLTKTLVLHGAVGDGVYDVVPLLHELGFVRIQADHTVWSTLGLVVAWIDD
jgi:demethylmenaquinone methyltransferase/2-methoxy-6-polyprenyl-1,4-benzoquinol methylase/phosphoethanolamine N-methyltransferase